MLELCLGKKGAETCNALEIFLTMVSTESSLFCKNSFGKTICAPNTASAGERPVSSLGYALSPRSTKGSSSDHVVAAGRARSASLRRWCSLSTAPSTQVDKLLFVMENVKHFAKLKPKIGNKLRSTIRSDCFGHPKREIQVKAFTHSAANVSERGMASIHLDVRSIIVKI